MPLSRSNRMLVLALFFLSGISGLVYQIVWTRVVETSGDGARRQILEARLENVSNSLTEKM